MLDILAIDASDSAAVGALADVLSEHLDLEQRRQLLDDLSRWDRSLSRPDRDVLEAYQRMQARGAFVPVIMRAYLATVATLATSDEWREVLMWREFILGLSPKRTRAAA